MFMCRVAEIVQCQLGEVKLAGLLLHRMSKLTKCHKRRYFFTCFPYCKDKKELYTI